MNRGPRLLEVSQCHGTAQQAPDIETYVISFGQCRKDVLKGMS